MAMPPRNPAIQYVQPTIPPFSLPDITGETYVTLAPDTLDLAERARVAIHGMTAIADRNANGEIYWLNGFEWAPPTMYHDANDWIENKIFSPSLLLRQACGSDEGMDVEWHRMATMAQMQGDDGLLYLPMAGRPWGNQFGGEGFRDGISQAGQFAILAAQGRYCSVLETYHQLTGDASWRARAEKLLDALVRLSFRKDGLAYYAKSMYAPGEGRGACPAGMPPPSINFAFAWVGNGLLDYHRMTGSAKALDLAYGLARFFASGASGFVGPNGEFRANHICSTFEMIPAAHIHFHTNTHIRMLMLDAGIAMNDREMIDLARAGYRHGMAIGDTLMGYFPEQADAKAVNPAVYGNTTEICEVSEMVYLALRQSRAGLADEWDSIDRWMRNMVTESQLMETEWAYAFSRERGVDFMKDSARRDPAIVASNVGIKVPERFLGTWGGWIHPNDWQGDTSHRSVMCCCVGNMAMHFYRVWRDMVQFDRARNRLTVNLLMNRACAQADIHSYIPNRGLVRIEAKRDLELAVRVPEWVRPEACRCSVEGRPVDAAVEGRYLVVPVAHNATLAVEFPLTETAETRAILGTPFRITRRGNDIVDIEPRGTKRPIFHRAYARTPEVAMRPVTRFIPDAVLESY